MAELLVPVWDDFDALLRSAKAGLLICTPFYSVDGLGHVERYAGPGLAVRIRVRLSPSDWASGISDPEGLLILVDLLAGRGCNVEIGVNQRLHAKAYAADDAMLLMGSSNLTGGGFGNNFELMSRMVGDEARLGISFIDDGLRAHLRNVSIESLRDWVERARPVVDQAKALSQEENDQSGELLDAAQSRLDEVLGYGSVDHEHEAEPTPEDYERFKRWLQNHENLPGAHMVIARGLENLQRNSGKAKQSFYGAYRFLTEEPNFIEPLRRDLGALNQDEIYPFDDPRLSEAWSQYLDAHARDRTDFYSYPTLRGYLTPQLGGTRTGGGGGGSTFKRMMPLVAEYLGETK